MVSKRRNLYFKIGLTILKPALVYVLLQSCLYVYAQDVISLPSNITLVEGDTYRLDTFKANTSFYVRNKRIVNCNKNGIITANKKGKTVLIVKDHNKKQQVKINVKQKRKTESVGSFPILAWYSLQDDVSHEKYIELADAGFNLSFSEATDSIVPLMKTAIQSAKGTGVKLLIPFRGFWINVKPIVEYFKKQENVWGWYIIDEPSLEDLPKVKRFVNNITEYDREHPFYVNLLPSHANSTLLGTNSYEEYINSFIDSLRPSVVSFDNYPFKNSGLRNNYYSNLGLIAHYSQQYNIPFWAFACSVKYSESVPIPKLEHIKFEVFCSLAYGAQGIEYFTYTTPRKEHGGDHFSYAPIDVNQNKTDTYYYIKEVNFRIRSIESYILGAKPLYVGSLGANSLEGVELYKSNNYPPGIKSIKTTNTLLASWIQNDQSSIFMLVNTDVTKPAFINIKYDDSISKLSNDGQIVSVSPIEELPPGDMIVYVVSGFKE